MKRRDFLGATAAAGLGAVAGSQTHSASAAESGKGGSAMKAGFASVKITPPLGTTMMGFGGRDMAHGCTGVRDDIFVRALWLEQDDERALIMGYDLCFLGKADADRYKGAIGREIDLSPRQILMNTSHNHVGPKVGTWYSAGYEPPDRLYLNDLETATLKAAREARSRATEVTMAAGVTRSKLPVNRRRPEGGKIINAPNPDKQAYDRLPLCLLRDKAGKPVCLLFSISCHPSMMSGHEISGEYPGAATRKIDQHLGATCSLFLQGVGGDAKPLVIGDGVTRWQPGTWELMDQAGRIVADEAIAALDKGLQAVEPDLATALVEMDWALQPTPPRSHYEKIVGDTTPEQRKKNVRLLWAARQIELLDRYGTLPTSITLAVQGVRLGNGLRMIGIEGEAVGDWGFFIDDFYSKQGVTFPMGYTNGEGLYLPTSAMLPEGGYEVVSAWEYGLPSGLAAGMEEPTRKALIALRESGIV